ncbi:MAG: hypothetical protein CFE34_02610 [Rhodobacteraceae bacterium PARR1]|nr:MAG: hypothetical protein CFE34_02610 [Rhodobacteraceae bacterium PARR1]
MFLSRLLRPDGRPAIILRQGREAAMLKAAPDDPMPLTGIGVGQGLADIILRRGLGDPVDVEDLSAQGRLLLPVWAAQTVHLPLGVAEAPLPVVHLRPGQPFQTAPSFTLEGGIAALVAAGGAGAVLGWVQYHLVTCAALGQRQLSFGPELVVSADSPTGGGTGGLFAADGSQRSFPLPQVGRGDDGAVADLPPDTLMLRRLSRWLIRPASAQGLVALESRHVGAGLPLRNPLQAVNGQHIQPMSAITGQV